MSSNVRTFGQRGIARDQDPLDSTWHLKVGDRIYGPYTGHDMIRFHSESRLVATTLVMREGALGRDSDWHTAALDGVLGTLFRAPTATSPAFGKRGDVAESKFVLVMDIKGRRDPALDAAISAMGRAIRIAPNAWLVSGTHTANGIRNQLSQYLGATDWMLVIDANAARTASFNMGPEFDTKLRYVWPVLADS